MTLLREAADQGRENEPKLEMIKELYDQAEQLLISHGEDFVKPSDFPKFMSGLLKDTLIDTTGNKYLTQHVSMGNTPDVEVKMFCRQPRVSTDNQDTIVICLPALETSLVLRGPRTVIKDKIKHPKKDKGINDITLEDLTEWQQVLEAVADSFPPTSPQAV